MRLKGFQRKYLRALAHHIKPASHIGKDGVTDGLLYLINQHLDKHELMKIKFLQFKDKKKDLAKEISKKTASEIVGSIGNVTILFKKSTNPSKHSIKLPKQT